MANTITGLIPNILAGLDVVANEPVGLIQRVSRDINGEQVAKNQVVRSPITGEIAAGDSAPSATSPTGTQTVTYADVTISKDRSCVVTWNGDEETALGTVYGKVLSDNFAQAFRTLRNEVEGDLAALYTGASIPALGTAGTIPFASDISELAQVRKALRKAGAPVDGLMFVVEPGAFANLISKSTLIANANSNVNSAEVLSNAQLPMLFNLNIGESSGIKLVDDTEDYNANLFFHRSAIQLVARAPKSPTAGDAAVDKTTVQDPASGLIYTIAAYPQHRQISYEIGLAWGVAVNKGAFLGVYKG